jgi:chromosome partitioning protein
MRRICLLNQKGGVGKTTTAVSLAAILAEVHQWRVLFIDLDPQANATRWLGVDAESNGQGKAIFDAYCGSGDLLSHVVPTQTPRLDLLPGSSWLVGLERSLCTQPAAEFFLRDALAGSEERWDLIVIDCQPALNLPVIAALVACDDVLVPVETSGMSLEGLSKLTNSIARIRMHLNPNLSLGGILACRARRTSNAQTILERLRQVFPSEVFETVIRENVRLEEAWSYQTPIHSYDPKSNGTKDYLDVTSELLARWNKQEGAAVA